MPTTAPVDTAVDYASLDPKQLRGLYAKGIRNDHTRRAVADYARQKKAERIDASQISGGGEDNVTLSANEDVTAATAVEVGRGQTIRTPRPATAPRDLTPPEPPKPTPPAAVPMTPSTGTVRRLQALALIGITPVRVSEVTGIPVDSIWWLMMRPPTQVATPIHARLADAFRQLRVSPVSANTQTTEGRMAARAIALAETLDWAGPFDWDDIDFDQKPSTARRHRDPVLLQEAIDAVRLDMPAPLVTAEQVKQLEQELQRERDLTAELHKVADSRGLVVDSLKHDLEQERARVAELRKTNASNTQTITTLREQLVEALHRVAELERSAARDGAEWEAHVKTIDELRGDLRLAEHWRDEYARQLAERPADDEQAPAQPDTSGAVSHSLEAFSEALAQLPGISVHFHIGTAS